MNRQQAIELAKKHAQAKPESYFDKDFEPHEWVVNAILEAANTVTVKLDASDVRASIAASTQHIVETEAFADTVVEQARIAADMLGAFIDEDKPNPAPMVVMKHLIAMHKLMDGGQADLPTA